MSKERKANYSEVLLFPRAVEDWVGADHPARFLREVVEGLDLAGLGFEASAGEEGRPHYGNALLLKAWLWGYLNRIRSSRQLERACRENVGLIWLLGRQEPDHNTLWRFWRRNRRALKGLFREVVGIAVRSQVVGMVLHALDGTKIGAVASMQGPWHRRTLERDLARLDEWIEELEGAIEANERREEGSYRLPKELEDGQALRERIREAIEGLKQEQRGQRNAHEPEARVMPCEGKKRFAYNAQAVVDGDSGLIVGEAVTDDSADHRQLVPLLQETEHTLGGTAADTVTDKGYRNEQQMGEARERGYSVLVKLYETEGERAGRYHVSRFRYEAESDVFICPQGQALVYERTAASRHGREWKERIYRCHHAEQCPVAGVCSRDAAGRKVTRTPYWEALVEQRERQRDAGNRNKLKRRKGIVERAFAEIKQHLGFRRWNYRGLAAVRAEWAFLCTVYNLRKLYRVWQPGARLAAC